MRAAEVFVNNQKAGVLREQDGGTRYTFEYETTYNSAPVSLTMPVAKQHFEFACFPPFFDGVLPEGLQLEGLLKREKLDRTDYFGQLMVVGSDLVGFVTVKELK
jgi:serine/threonine-protein kinase HipA